MAKKEGSFAGWLQRVRKTGEHSDVTVKIQGQEFKLHMLPLVNESTYFQSLAANSPASTTTSPSSSANSSSASSSGAESSAAAASAAPPPLDRHHKRRHHHHHHHHHHHRSKSPRVVAIDELPGGAAAFAIAADFCYIIRPSYSFANVAPVRAAAEFLGMADLVDSTKKFLYSSVFISWKSCVAFLRDFERVYPSTDDYIESRALKVVTAAATKAFLDTKHVSVPLSSLSVAPPPPPPTCAAAAWHSSPSHNLRDILVAVAALPDRYARQLLDLLVASDTNLSIKCRQSRSVREWLDYLIASECKRINARVWIVLCLSRMLLKNAPNARPWLELSSQYWCSLLEHAAALLAQTDDPAAADGLAAVKAALERRIGASLHELDDYIQAYSFEPDTLLALVRHFIAERRRRKGGGGGELGQEEGGEGGADELDDELDDEEERESEIDDSEGEIEAVASEVDGCLWGYAEGGAISTATFVALEAAFPRECRGSHDMLFSAVERMLAKRRLGGDDVQTLWKFVDCSRLSAPVYERAMSNPSYLSQPHVLECVLRRHGNELADDPRGEGGDARHDLKDIMRKVIGASLKLLEENSRRSKEIKQLQRQFAGLVSSGFKVFPSREDHDKQHDSPDSFDVIPPPAPAPVVAPPPRHGNSEIREIQL